MPRIDTEAVARGPTQHQTSSSALVDRLASSEESTRRLAPNEHGERTENTASTVSSDCQSRLLSETAAQSADVVAARCGDHLGPANTSALCSSDDVTTDAAQSGSACKSSLLRQRLEGLMASHALYVNTPTHTTQSEASIRLAPLTLYAAPASMISRLPELRIP